MQREDLIEKLYSNIDIRLPVRIFIPFIFMVAVGCQESPQTPPPSQTPDTLQVPGISELRQAVSNKPVAQYREKVDNPLNDWYFSVQLFETQKKFHYIIKLGYEEIRGEDTLKLPNFGTEPKPVIQKGPEKYSCIIGFLDKENKFREYKKVHVKGNILKITAIKHYGVSSYTK